MDNDRIQESERVWLVGIFGADFTRQQSEEHLEELALLADTAGGFVVGSTLQHKHRPDSSSYLGKGKLSELVGLVKENEVDVLIFDDDLTPTQARNIHEKTKLKVLDRSGLILDIFAGRAKSAAAKTQVELAQLEYLLPRLTRLWTHLSRQKGGIGTKGPGETQLETDRRLIDRRIAVLKQKLIKLEKQRTTQRRGRSDKIRVALVGYTNAGKSSLINTLTEAEVFAENRLFATLDATVRRMVLYQQEILISDTVGFIRKLPHGLIESFKSTLDEILEADFLLHIVDGSSPQAYDYIRVVDETLKEIGAGEKPRRIVFNKVDNMHADRIRDLAFDFPDAVFISATRNIGIEELHKALFSSLNERFLELTLKIPYEDHKIVAFLHEVADVTGKDGTELGYEIRCTIDKIQWESALQRFPQLLEAQI